jgi:CTP synthase (UTP-ammonia lyase)
LQINLQPNSRVSEVYGKTEIQEYYYCNFGINPEFQQSIDEAGLEITGTDQDREPRVVELPEHRFFIATLFVPGASYTEGIIEMKEAHPLVKALLEEGISFRKEREEKKVRPF